MDKWLNPPPKARFRNEVFLSMPMGQEIKFSTITEQVSKPRVSKKHKAERILKNARLLSQRLNR